MGTFFCTKLDDDGIVRCHAVVPHVLDSGRRQLVEHLGMSRPHVVPVVALQQHVRALVVKIARSRSKQTRNAASR